MKNKLMISALLFCSSLVFAEGDLSTAPTTAPVAAKKKPSKEVVAPSSAFQHPDDVGLGGLGTAGTSAPARKIRGTAQPHQK